MVGPNATPIGPEIPGRRPSKVAASVDSTWVGYGLVSWNRTGSALRPGRFPAAACSGDGEDNMVCAARSSQPSSHVSPFFTAWQMATFGMRNLLRGRQEGLGWAADRLGCGRFECGWGP
jgi:hypothetical protein